MLSERIIFNETDYFEVIDTRTENGLAEVTVVSRQQNIKCPDCNIVTPQVHSYYHRKIKDLPAFDYRIILRIKARKFYCRNAVCAVRVFTERFEHMLRYQRTTRRLNEKLLRIAIIVGANSGSKLCCHLRLPASSSTLLRQIHRKSVAEIETSDTIGIDDWAFRKGVNYGTAVVDLKKGQIVDLLPDRTAITIENWLKKRPHIKIVTRDRYNNYAKAVRNGLPDAAAVADRWHLIKNFGDSLQKVLLKSRQELRRANKEAVIKQSNTPSPGSVLQLPSPVLSKNDILLQQAKAMKSKGIAIRQIASSLHMSRNTVRKYLRLQEAPVKNEGKTNLYLFYEYLQERMEQLPNIEIMQLFKEVVSKGYKGSRSTFYHHLKDYTNSSQRKIRPPLNDVSWLPSKVCIQLYKKDDQLSVKDKTLLHSLQEKSVDIKCASALTKKFRQLIDTKSAAGLFAWIKKVNCSGMQELKGFANGLLNDYEAVKNAIQLPWSNGPVEGHINKLKTIKRQMYGRAGFNLLKKKILLGYD